MIHRRNWYWWLAGAIVFVVAVPALASIIAAVVVAVVYGLSLAVHPFITCRTCGGNGRQAASVFGYAHRQCGSCGGQGRHRRLGLVIFRRNRPVWAERRALNARETRPSRPL